MEGINFVAGNQEEMGITWDSSVPGLGLRKNKRSKVWILKYRNQGRQVNKVIGPADIISRDEARALAKTIKWDAKQGKLPKPKKKLIPITVADFCKEYIERHAKPKNPKSWLKAEQRLKYHIYVDCESKDVSALKGAELARYQFGRKQLSTIEGADIAKLHAEIGKTAPVAANRLVEQLRKMFKLAVLWKYFPKEADNPAADIDFFPEKKKIRWLTRAEMEKLIPHINALPVMRATYFWLLIWTGRRRSEILELKWEQVDLSLGTIYLGETKNGDPDLILLQKKAIEMLKALPSRNQWVFPGRGDKHWKRPDKVWWKIRAMAGLPGVTIHHLRHTVATRLLEKKYPLKVVGEVLGHKSLAASSMYAHVAKEHLREVLEDHASDLPNYQSA